MVHRPSGYFYKDNLLYFNEASITDISSVMCYCGLSGHIIANVSESEKAIQEYLHGMCLVHYCVFL